MSTMEGLRQRIKKRPKLVVSDSIRARKGERSFDKDGVRDRENESEWKLNKKVEWKGVQSGGEWSEREFGERGKFRTLDSSGRKKREYGKDKLEWRGVKSGGEWGEREFGERGKFRTLDSSGRKKREYAKDKLEYRGVQSGGEWSEREFGERGKFRTLDSSGRKKRVYAKEGENGKKTSFKKWEKQVRDEPVEGKTKQRTMWVADKSRIAGSPNMKGKKESVVLNTAKHKTKAKEVGRVEFIGTDDDHGSGLVKKNREKRSEFSKGKSHEVESPSSSDKKKNARYKEGLEDDAETQDGRRKKKKKVMRIDPHDISNKRLEDAFDINGR